MRFENWQHVAMCDVIARSVCSLAIKLELHLFPYINTAVFCNKYSTNEKEIPKGKYFSEKNRLNLKECVLCLMIFYVF